MEKLIAIIIGYIFGNFLFALIVGKYFLHADPTKAGSGNPGTANVGAVYGKKWGFLTLVGDALKSVLSLLITYLLFKNQLLLAYCGLGLMLGHCYPVVNHFKGGKGVAVVGITILAVDFKTALISLLLALVLVIGMQNLTIPPIFFTFCFVAVNLYNHQLEIALVIGLAGIVMIHKFWKDIIDFIQGRGKRVDILFSIKRKLGLLK
ncbi:glycerol-3-phosphate acyltransferase [Lactobacillus psittaci]|uniref:Glycerol-3-phosphate acyltransferase n=1 Tax=Lactobacillus psittaci DSM 15354 TaxID=1122152 RepID=A0A0R1S6W0_9LACO|nr:glycerol-3-phosphate acyltransferase [Lactobacillus psittaci]KRL63268.1 membrane protein [Lactobacillus psittaci DSM 15354]